MSGIEHGESFIDRLAAHLSELMCPTTKILTMMRVFSPQHQPAARPL